MTPEKRPREGLPDDREEHPQTGRREHEPRSETRGTALDTDEASPVRDKPYPLADTESDIAGTSGVNAYHETGGAAGRLDRENRDARNAERRDSRTRVSPENPEEPTQEPSGKHTNQ